MTIELEKLIDLAYEHAVRILVGEPPGTQLAPTFLIEIAENAIILMATPWRSDREKDQMTRSLAATMRVRGARAYSFLSEAWMASVPADGKSLEEAAKQRFTDAEMPSNRPDRIEVVMIMAADRQRAISKVYRMIRGEAGTVLRLEQKSDIDAAPLYGRFANLLQGSESDD